MAPKKYADGADPQEHPTQLDLQALPKPKARPPRGRIRLVVVNESLLNTHVLPEKGEVVIGRSPDVQIYVPHPSVSRRHAIVRIGPTLTIEDLESANGTAINNIRATAGRPVEIGPDDSIRLGRVLVVVQRDWEEEPPRDDAAGTAQLLELGRIPAEETARSFVVAGRPIVATSDALRRILALVARVATTDVNVLVLGETGTGKEIVAHAIHERSPRRKAPFLSLNCAALSEPLLESELFGHEKGAFTGAHETKIGLLEKAQHGTVFLDEIGDMAPAVQAKLLRVFEDRQLLRLGSVQPRPIDVRFVTATNRNLAAEAQAGRFRMDFYFRLSGVTLQIPPLRDRRVEIEPLAHLFLTGFAAQAGLTKLPELAREALERLLEYSWPGNVRELKNVVERAALVCDGGPIRAEHIQTGLVDLASPPTLQPGGHTAPTQHHRVNDLQGEISAIERRRIVDALERCGGNQTRAAELLGIPRRTFIRKLHVFGLQRPRKGGASPAEDAPDSTDSNETPLPASD